MLRPLSRWLSPSAGRTAPPQWRPHLNQLEDRSTPATVTGNTITLDDPSEVLTISTSTAGTYLLESTVDVNGSTGPALFIASPGQVDVEDGATGTGVAFANSSAVFAHPFRVTLSNRSAGVTFSGAVNFGANNLTATTDRAIGVSVGASLTATSGNVSLTATGTVAGPIIGVDVAGAVRSDTGTVSITGKGGDGPGALARYGVRVSGGGTVGTTGGTGTVSVTGTGGVGNNTGNYGVFVDGATAAITSGGGTVNVLGTGGSGNGYAAVGVHVAGGGRIAGGGAGAVNVLGTGGWGSGSHDYGTLVQGANSLITSAGGTVAVTGYAGDGGAGGVGIGVYLYSGGRVVGGGTTGGVVITGVGGGLGGQGNHGVYVAGYANGAPEAVSSGGGPVAVTGFGGGGPVAANGTGMGVHLAIGGRISAGGTGAVDVTGYGGPSSGFGAFGVLVQNTGSAVTSSGGNVTVQGVAGANQTGGVGTGVYVNAGGTITAGGMGTVSVNGDGGATIADGGYGVYVVRANSAITSGGGAVVVTGTGGGSGGFSGSSVGVVVSNLATITSGTNAPVNVTGTGRASGSSTGVFVQGDISNTTDTFIRSGGGTLTVTGTAGAAGAAYSSSAGVFVGTAGGIVPGLQAAVTVTGTGGGSGNPAYSVGVYVRGYYGLLSGVITSGGGAVTVQGFGRDPAGSGRGNGVYLEQGGQVSAGGTAAINISGTGYRGQGVYVNSDYLFGTGQTAATSVTGAGTVTVTGTVVGDPSSVDEYGVFMFGRHATLTATGAGSLGVTGSHSNGNTGVLLYQGAKITTAGVPVTVTTDSLDLVNPASVNFPNPGITAGTGTVTLQPLTAGTRIDVGGADVLTGSPRTLGLSTFDLSRITAGTLILGSNIAGTLTLSADVTRAAATNVQLVTGGDLTSAPTFGRLDAGGGSIALGVSGSLFSLRTGVDFVASQVTSSPITLALSVNGTTPDTQYQQVNVTGDLFLLGFTLALSGAYVPQVGDVFTLASATNLFGTFTGLADGATISFNGATLRINYTATAVIATAV